MKVQISLAQLAFRLGDTVGNIKKAEKYIRAASRLGSEIILLPELWASGFDLPQWKDYATSMDTGVFKKVRDFAVEYKIAIGCSLLELDQGIGYNTFVFYSAEGDLIGKYRKIHRFRLLQEDKYLGAGDQICIVDTKWGRIGFAVCYDLRFPELFRKLAVENVELVLLVAEWPHQRIEHWDTLLRARAIENQYILAAVNKIGESSGVQLGGHSTILDAWGKEIVYSSQNEGLVTGIIDIASNAAVRNKIPVLQDRRQDIYDGW